MYLITAPTDGEHEDQTRERLLAFFRRHFWRLTFFEIQFYNDHLTPAGESATYTTGARA